MASVSGILKEMLFRVTFQHNSLSNRNLHQLYVSLKWWIHGCRDLHLFGLQSNLEQGGAWTRWFHESNISISFITVSIIPLASHQNQQALDAGKQLCDSVASTSLSTTTSMDILWRGTFMNTLNIGLVLHTCRQRKFFALPVETRSTWIVNGQFYSTNVHFFD